MGDRVALSVVGRGAPCARATVGEIPGGGTGDEKSRPKGGEMKSLVEPNGIDHAERRGCGTSQGQLALSHPRISVGRGAPCARATVGEIPGGGTGDEKSRPKGGELKSLVEPNGIEPSTS